MATAPTNLEASVLSLIKHNGPNGMTLDDLVYESGLDKVTVSPRLRPLEQKGLISRDGKRGGRSGRKQTVWKVQ